MCFHFGLFKRFEYGRFRVEVIKEASQSKELTKCYPGH